MLVRTGTCRCWDSIAKHISNPDVGAILKRGVMFVIYVIDWPPVRHMLAVRLHHLKIQS